MRRASLLLIFVWAAGCGGGLESQVSGAWEIDPASVSTPRLIAGADKKPDWTDALGAISKVRVTFSASKEVEATGFGARSRGIWGLSGQVIQVKDRGNDVWPQMILDPNGTRIHVTLQQGADSLRVDLVKVFGLAAGDRPVLD